ncbi:MAE_28990/MAE_18760 family HEPN-like nuclease [Micrococcus sp. HG099]|nr:HEPN domain-containing protein [Micrococcus sp. HG099]MCR8674379.1 MAE_28990/MAE_18760 family HEPN-like nuclease [Micrococcus sp. HG099]
MLEEALKSINPGFDSTTLARDFTTPRPDKIDKLLLLLGIDRISQQISWNNAGNKAARKDINELQNARNTIAHGEQNAKATKSDVNRFRRYVEGFCSGVDKIVAERVTNMTGVRPW